MAAQLSGDAVDHRSVSVPPVDHRSVSGAFGPPGASFSGMGRHANQAVPPPPAGNAAGKLQSRRPASASRTRPVAPPVKPVAESITGVVYAPLASSRDNQPSDRAVAGRATGKVHATGKGRSHAAAEGTPGKVSGKKHYPTADSHVGADNAAGNPTRAAEHSGIFSEGHQVRAAAAYGARSSADSVIFGRDVDHSAGRANPHEAMLHGAAGVRSEASGVRPPMSLQEHGADRVGFEDIPRAKFSAPGLGPAPHSTAYRGAAGATSNFTDQRFQRDLQPNRAKLRPGDGAQAEHLVFGHEMAPPDATKQSAATQLYSGAGARSETASTAQAWNQLHDVSVRTASKPTDQQMLLRDFGASAGAHATQLGQKACGAYDVTQMPHLGSGAGDLRGRVGVPSGFQEQHPQGVKPAVAILEGEDPYDTSEYAGVGSSYMAWGEPGQQKFAIGQDFVMVRPVGDISDMVMDSEAHLPSAG